MKEYFWVVDEEDNIIGKETREKCHNEKLIHRSVYIFLINSRNEMFLQKRAKSKDLYAGYFTGSATGHVDYGENYDQAARRELKEELGLDISLKRVSKFRTSSEIENEMSTLYFCCYDGKIVFNRKEISQGIFMNLKKVEEHIENGEKVALGFKIAFKEFAKYVSNTFGKGF